MRTPEHGAARRTALRRRGLVWPTALTLLLATLVPIVVLSIGGIWVMRAALTERVGADLEALADSKRRALELSGERGLDTVRLLATRTQVRSDFVSLLAGMEHQRGWLVDALAESRDAVDGMVWLGLADVDGRVEVATDVAVVGRRPLGTPAVEEQEGQPVPVTVSRVVTEPDGPAWYVAAPLVERDAPAGWVLAELDLDRVAPVVDDATDRQRGMGTCVSYRDGGRLVPLLEPGGTRLPADTLGACAAAELLVGVADVTGGEVVAAVREVEPLDWVLTVAVSTPDLLAPVADATRLALALTGVVLVLVAVSSVLLARQLTRPMQALGAASAALEAGTPGAAADEDAPGELGELGARFNAMAQALHEGREDLERRYTDLELLSHAMAHDLKNPLTMVRGSFDLLGGERVVRDEDRALLLERGAGAARRMQQLIDDLLILIRAVGTDPAAEPVALEEVVDACIDHLDAADRVRRGALPEVAGDRVLLDHLVGNLLGNALTYHRPDQPPRVEVSAEVGPDGLVELRVDDAGLGIPPDEREAALALFVRGERTSDRPGSGLGLPISLRIAERHGGTLRIDDSPLGGARIVVRLPTTPCDRG